VTEYATSTPAPSVAARPGPPGEPGPGRLVYRIGMVGPSRVGKTSLITALLHDGQRLLEGTPISMKAIGTATQKRLSQHRRELDGSLLAGEFDAGALGGSQDQFTFHLLLDTGVPDTGIELQLLDYPGGWLDPHTRPAGVEAQWEECERFLEQCSVLIVPIDAAVLMEATTASHLRAVPTVLGTPQVTDVVRTWLKRRNERPDEPALLLLCPVKCESYFDDNGGRRDLSATLLQWVRRVYRSMIELVPNEAPDVRNMRAVYAPVDTIGCVEILRADWLPEPDEPGALTFMAHYGVRPPGERSVKGTEDIMIALCRQLVAGRQKVEEREAGLRRQTADAAQTFAERDEGFFRNIWFLVTGERRLRADAARTSREEAIQAADRAQALTGIVESLSRRAHSERVHQW
jgi:hypothetical protein